jgi:hypothetical protein
MPPVDDTAPERHHSALSIGRRSAELRTTANLLELDLVEVRT